MVLLEELKALSPQKKRELAEFLIQMAHAEEDEQRGAQIYVEESTHLMDFRLYFVYKITHEVLPGEPQEIKITSGLYSVENLATDQFLGGSSNPEAREEVLNANALYARNLTRMAVLKLLFVASALKHSSVTEDAERFASALKILIDFSGNSVWHEFLEALTKKTVSLTKKEVVALAKKELSRLTNLYNLSINKVIMSALQMRGQETRGRLPKPAIEEDKQGRRALERKIVSAMVEIISSRPNYPLQGNFPTRQDVALKVEEKTKSQQRENIARNFKRDLDKFGIDFETLRTKARKIVKANRQKNKV